MKACINKDSAQYQTLKERSGLPEFILDATCRGFLDRYGRWPNLDELPNVDSSEALSKALNLNENGFTSTDTILNYFGKSNIKDAIIEANKQFSDLEISVLQIGDEAIVKYIKRPNEYNLLQSEDVKIKDSINFPIYIGFQLQKLADLYGINIIPVTTSELNEDERFKGFPIESQSIKGFVYNGNIYLNVNNLTADTPVHELLHLFLGSIRFTNPELYVKLISKAEQFSNYKKALSYFKDRTRQDINEELFIQEFAKYITGNPSQIQNLNEKDLYEINYNINRVLDSMLMGQHSVKLVDNKYLMSIKQIAELVKSEELNGTSSSSLTDSTIHRILDNMKSDLMSNGELKEYC